MPAISLGQPPRLWPLVIRGKGISGMQYAYNFTKMEGLLMIEPGCFEICADCDVQSIKYVLVPDPVAAHVGLTVHP